MTYNEWQTSFLRAQHDAAAGLRTVPPLRMAHVKAIGDVFDKLAATLQSATRAFEELGRAIEQADRASEECRKRGALED